VFGLLLLASAVPVLTHPVLPQQDAPNHIAIVSTLARHGSPGWDQQFEWRLGLRPYATYYALGYALAKAFGGLVAHRILVLLYVLLLPLAFLDLLRALGVHRWASLPSFLLVYSDAYLAGFTNHLLALPLFLFGLACAVRVAKGGGLRWRVGLTALGWAMLLTHPLVAAVWLVCAGTVLVSYRQHGRGLLFSALFLVPVVVPLILYAAGQQTAPGSVRFGAAFKARYFVETPLLFVDAVAPSLALPIALALAAILAEAIVRLVRGGAWRRWPRRSPRWGLLVLGAAYLLLPFGRGATVWLDARVAWFCWVYLFLALGPHLATTRLGKITATLVCLAAIGVVEVGHRRFAREVHPLFGLIERAPADQRVLCISTRLDSRAIQPFYTREREVRFFSLYAHIGSYYHARRGGISPLLTFHPTMTWIPIGLRDSRYGRTFSIDDPFVPKRVLDRIPSVRNDFDLILLRGDQPPVLARVERFASPIAEAELFHLYAMRSVPG
jgi:hypothetical protein